MGLSPALSRGRGRCGGDGVVEMVLSDIFLVN